MEYVLKPVEAFQIGMGDYIPLWVSQSLKNSENGFEVTTLSGVVTAKKGDYVIETLPGKLSILSKELFEHLYHRHYNSNVRLGSSQLC